MLISLRDSIKWKNEIKLTIVMIFNITRLVINPPCVINYSN